MKIYTLSVVGAGPSSLMGIFIEIKLIIHMKTLKFITIYPEVYDNKDLTPNEKIYLSVIHFFTKGKAHGCKLSDQELSDELSIGINQIRKIKSKLKKLGLISVNNKAIIYKKILPNSNLTLPNSNEILPNSNQIPCNSDENQQVTEGKDKKNKKEIKENKEEKQEKEESFLDDWEKQVMLEKEEQKKNSLNNSTSNNSTINNSCTVIDMVMGLPNNKEDVPINDEPESKSIDRNSLLDTITKKMVEKIDYNIRIQSNEIKHEYDRKRFLEENRFNELQLTKHIKEYLKDRDLTKIIQDVNVFNRFAINAFNSYKNEIKKSVSKLPKKNPYSDLEDSNSSNNDYKETNRWLKK